MTKLFHLTAMCFCILVLASCEGAREQLGLERNPPDEFAVVKRAPLSMPPNYTLRPPRPGALRPQEQAPIEQARETVFGQQTRQIVPETPDDAEKAFLQQAGALQTDPAIRKKIDAETQELRDRNKPVAQKLLGIGGNRDEISASVVDAPEETARIRQNIEEGKPLTEGETPSIED